MLIEYAYQASLTHWAINGLRITTNLWLVRRDENESHSLAATIFYE